MFVLVFFKVLLEPVKVAVTDKELKVSGEKSMLRLQRKAVWVR